MFLITRRDNLCPKTGLEPVIALLEGKCLNHLNYSGSYNCCARLFQKGGTWRTDWSGWRDLNPRPSEWQSDALPTEPQPHMVSPASERVQRSLVWPRRRLEAIFRIELKTKGYKALVLPLNYIATWSAWWGTIPQPAAWKAATLANWATRAFKWFLSQPCINIISRFSRKIKFSWYLRVESNHWPVRYERTALTIWAT